MGESLRAALPFPFKALLCRPEAREKVVKRQKLGRAVYVVVSIAIIGGRTLAYELCANCYSGKVVKIETGESLRAALPFAFGGDQVERKRVAGRFVREGLDGDVGASAGRENKGAGVKSPRPKFCRSFARARVAAALPEIVDRFVAEAKKGSIAHTKMLANLGGLDKGEVPEQKRRRGKSVVGRLLENLSKHPEK